MPRIDGYNAALCDTCYKEFKEVHKPKHYKPVATESFKYNSNQYKNALRSFLKMEAK